MSFVNTFKLILNTLTVLILTYFNVGASPFALYEKDSICHGTLLCITNCFFLLLVLQILCINRSGGSRERGKSSLKMFQTTTPKRTGILVRPNVFYTTRYYGNFIQHLERKIDPMR